MASNWLTWLRGRTWLQFSLRTFFVLVTLACLSFALLERRARQRQQAIARIQKLGGSVTFEHERDSKGHSIKNAASPAPSWAQGSAGEEYFRKVFSAGITAPWHGHSLVTDDNLACLRHLTELKFLDLTQAETDGSGLRH